MADFLGGGGAGMPTVGGSVMPFAGMPSLPGGAMGAVPPMPFGATTDASPAALLQDPEEEILRRYQTLQKVRKAAAQAAQIADIDAAELRRLESHTASLLEAAGVPRDVMDRMRQKRQQEQAKEEGQEQQQQQAVATEAPAEAPAAPPRSEEEMKERSQRVIELGNYWAAQERGEAPVDAAAAVAAAAREAGSFPALAAALRARLTTDTAAERQEVAPKMDSGAVAVPQS